MYGKNDDEKYTTMMRWCLQQNAGASHLRASTEKMVTPIVRARITSSAGVNWPNAAAAAAAGGQRTASCTRRRRQAAQCTCATHTRHAPELHQGAVDIGDFGSDAHALSRPCDGLSVWRTRRLDWTAAKIYRVCQKSNHPQNFSDATVTSVKVWLVWFAGV